MSHADINVDTAELVRAAAELDTIAELLESRISTFGKGAVAVAPALDEVSSATARTANASAAVAVADAASGVREIRNVAAALRAQARHLTAADIDAAAALRA